MPAFAVTSSTQDAAGRPIRRQRAYVAPTRGIRLPKDQDTFEARCDAAILALPSSAVLAEVTAARLWGLPVPNRRTMEQVVAVVPPGSWQPQRNFSHVYRRILHSDEIVILDGRTLTTPARTFADCARSWSLPDALALGDAAVRACLMTIEEATSVVRRMRRLPGLKFARRVLPFIDSQAGSPQESRVRGIIINAGLPIPRPNVRILDENGGFIAIGDLVYDEWMIVIEYDGAHHRDPLRQAKDATRRTRLREIGFYVVEITADDVRWPSRVVEKVLRALDSRGVDIPGESKRASKAPAA